MKKCQHCQREIDGGPVTWYAVLDATKDWFCEKNVPGHYHQPSPDSSMLKFAS